MFCVCVQPQALAIIFFICLDGYEVTETISFVWLQHLYYDVRDTLLLQFIPFI